MSTLFSCVYKPTALFLLLEEEHLSRLGSAGVGAVVSKRRKCVDEEQPSLLSGGAGGPENEAGPFKRLKD